MMACDRVVWDMKSVEQKLYEAFVQHKGCRLTQNDVTRLVNLDDAIRTRITNHALAEAGVMDGGMDGMIGQETTWNQFKKRLKREAGVEE